MNSAKCKKCPFLRVFFSETCYWTLKKPEDVKPEECKQEQQKQH